VKARDNLNYWRRVRMHFPAVFARRAAQERKLGLAINRVTRDGVRSEIFLDELPPGDPTGPDTVQISCGLLCMAEADGLSPNIVHEPHREDAAPVTVEQGQIGVVGSGALLGVPFFPNTLRADDVRITCPLFQAEYGGEVPTSAHHLRFSRTDIRRAVRINRQLHSRLPELTNWQGCRAFAAECANVVYAVAIWGQPVARMLNGRGWIELRRMAIAADAPKNTATRMIGWMLRELKKEACWTRAISYQDTAVHTGTIYRASGWTVGNRSEGGEWSRPSRGRDAVQTSSEKVRWEYPLTSSPNNEVSR